MNIFTYCNDNHVGNDGKYRDIDEFIGFATFMLPEEYNEAKIDELGKNLLKIHPTMPITTHQSFYHPLLLYILSLLSKNKKKEGRRPLIVGLSAPFGCGKTTLTTHLTSLLSHLSIPSICVSIDDFCLTNRDQQILASK